MVESARASARLRTPLRALECVVCVLLVRAGSSVDMVSVSRVFFLGVAGHALGQSAWQAGEPIEVNIDYDVPSIGVADGTALMHRSRASQAKLSAAASASMREPSNGYSAMGLFAGSRLLGDALPVDEAEVVVHVPAPDLSSAEEAALLANVQRQFGMLRRLREGQRSQEERALSFAGGFAFKQGSELVPRAGEAVAEAEVVPSHADGTSRQVGELVAEVRAGGYVARRALEELVSLAANSGARGSIIASGAPGAASELLKRHGTSESNRALAGSLLTLLSGMPVAAEVSNERTGADGHVEIVLPRPSRIYGPDSAAMQLSAGVFASHVQA